jgi:hypothetical protein
MKISAVIAVVAASVALASPAAVRLAYRALFMKEGFRD